MAAKISYHRYGTKIRHGHPMRETKNFSDTNIPVPITPEMLGVQQFYRHSVDDER